MLASKNQKRNLYKNNKMMYNKKSKRSNKALSKYE